MRRSLGVRSAMRLATLPKIPTIPASGYSGFKSNKSDRGGVHAKHSERIGRILDRLHAIAKPENMALSGYAFHPVNGDTKGKYWVSVSGNCDSLSDLSNRSERDPWGLPIAPPGFYAESL